MSVAAVLYVKDLRLMEAFYEKCFALSRLVSGSPDFSVLGSGQGELSLVSVPETVAATLTIADPPRRRKDSPLKLAFDVSSIESLRAVIADAGGRLDAIQSVWTFRGRRHLDCVDPEGNVVQLRERI